MVRLARSHLKQPMWWKYSWYVTQLTDGRGIGHHKKKMR
jgi:hypothetical protein